MNVTNSLTQTTTTLPITTSPTTASPSQWGINWYQGEIYPSYARSEYQLNATVEKLNGLEAQFKKISEGLPLDLEKLEHLQETPNTDTVTDKEKNLSAQLKEKLTQLERCTQEREKLKTQIDCLIKQREMISQKEIINNIR